MTHSILAGRTAQELLRSYLSTETRQELAAALNLSETDLISFAGYLAALHDIGKLSTAFMWNIAAHLEDSGSFQTRLRQAGLAPRTASATSYGHELSSQQAAYALWLERRPQDQNPADFFARILGAHHQRRHTVHCDQSRAAKWNQYHREFESAMAAEFGWDQPLPHPDPQCKAFAGALLNGLTVLADWIASGNTFADADDWLVPGSDELRNRIEGFLLTSGLHAAPAAIPETFAAAWPAIGETMRPLQTAVESHFQGTAERTGLMIIEAPMGEGKTEAALYAAGRLMEQWGKTGLYVALPTAATANQMHGRVQSFLQQHGTEAGARLLHAMAWLVDRESETLTTSARTGAHDAAMDAAAEWLKPVRRGLLGPYAVGTVDQAMMAAMFIRYGVLRLLGLTNKVLIIDEVHAYDAYMQEILSDLLAWCRELRVPVVLLSATLTAQKKADLLAAYGAAPDEPSPASYPLITAVSETGRVQHIAFEAGVSRQPISVSVDEILDDPDAIADRAVRLVADGGCLGIIVNTVKQAQAVYRALQSKWDGTLMLFHARYPASRRAEIEQECLACFGPDKHQRPERAILVATQVAEQSLDVDFDVMMTSAAPIDLVLQRAGRLYRHADTPRPPHIQSPQLIALTDPSGEYPADSNVYPLCLLHRSEALLRRSPEVRIPQDLRTLVEDGYSMADAESSELDEWLENMFANDAMAGQATNARLGHPADGFRPLSDRPVLDDLESGAYVSAQTRLGSPTLRIALLGPDLLTQLRAQAGTDNTVAVTESELAKAVLAQSVSVPEQYMQGFSPDLIGSGLLSGVQIYAAVDGVHTQNGRELAFDHELGVVWRDQSA